MSRLVLNGVESDLLAYLRGIPALGESLPDPFDPDETAAAHYALFGMNLFPFEAIFLDGSGLLGGEVSEAVARSYQRMGFDAGPTAVSPDHLGHELAALAHLCRAEAETPALAAGARAQQRDLLERHLLRWLVPLVEAVRCETDAFFTAVANLTLAVTADHYADLTASDAPNAHGFALPQPPDVLSSDRAGLKEIASLLTTPPYSGLLLGRGQIARLARALDLPRGFGDRGQMLTNLLRTAVQYDQFPAVVDGLSELVHARRMAYADGAAAAPALTPFVTPWLDRSDQTLALLAEMRSAALAG